MLTPVELQNKTFKSGGLGYDKKDVEQFFREVTDEFTRLYSENVDLKDRVDALNDALQRYKTMENTLQKALVLAQKTAEDTTQAAVKNARNIEKEAQLKSQIIMADARNELERVHAQTLAMLQQFEKYKAQVKSLAVAQVELLESDSYSINAERLEAFIDTSRTALPRTFEAGEAEAFKEAKPITPTRPEAAKPIRKAEPAKTAELTWEERQRFAKGYADAAAEETDDGDEFDFINL